MEDLMAAMDEQRVQREIAEEALRKQKEIDEDLQQQLQSTSGALTSLDIVRTHDEDQIEILRQKHEQSNQQISNLATRLLAEKDQAHKARMDLDDLKVLATIKAEMQVPALGCDLIATFVIFDTAGTPPQSKGFSLMPRSHIHVREKLESRRSTLVTENPQKVEVTATTPPRLHPKPKPKLIIPKTPRDRRSRLHLPRKQHREVTRRFYRVA
jgi:hypothetical protein